MAIYRGHRRTCPACESSMEEIPVPLASGEQAEIDHCARCGGVYLEFFDGDPVALSVGTLELLIGAGGAKGSHASHETVSCPDCGNFMPLLRYHEVGPAVFRCEGCMAIFASRQQLHALADYREPDLPEEPPSLLDRLRAFFSAE